LPALLSGSAPGVDASYIPAAIAEQRGRVLLSAMLQTLCAIAIVPAALSAVGVRSRLAHAGAALRLVGALGNSADAVFNQVSPAERATAAVRRFDALPDGVRGDEVQILPAAVGSFHGVVIAAADHVLFGILHEDAAPAVPPKDGAPAKKAS
jgi:hypothetical protein